MSDIRTSRQAVKPAIASKSVARATVNRSRAPATPALALKQRMGNQAASAGMQRSPLVQAKLTVSQPGDAQEHEGDRMAERVMRKANSAAPSGDGSCNICAPSPSGASLSADPPAMPVQRKPVAGATEPCAARREAEDQRAEMSGVQFKLTIGAPNDPFEQEADRAAAAATAGRKVPDISPMSARVSREPAGDMTIGGDSDELGGRITSPSGGRPLPSGLRGDMESSFGTDFSAVRVHDGSQDRRDAATLGARAFTHGSGIWLGSGASVEDRGLMAHELAHVVQQGGDIRRQPESGTEQGTGAASSLTVGGTPDVQAAWYNFSIPFTDYEFDPSIEGIKTAAGVVKDSAVGTVEWVFDKIKSVINAGIEWLTDQFNAIKEFAVAAFDMIKDDLRGLAGLLTDPLSLLTSAFQTMDARSIRSAWSLLKSGARMLWDGIKGTITRVMGIATGLWDTVSGYISSLFATVNGLLDGWLFRRLPDFLQRAAYALFDEIRNLWETVRAFITDLLQRLRQFTDGILQSAESFFNNVIAYGIEAVISAVQAISDTWNFVKEVASDPIGFIRPHTEQLAGKLNAETPPKAIALGEEKLNENAPMQGAARSKGAHVQRQAGKSSAKPARSVASQGEADKGIVEAIRKAWGELDIGKMLLDTVVNMFWPPATIRAIGEEFSKLWSTDWANAASSLFAPREPWDDFLGFFHDLWSNLLVLLDFPLALWRRLNNVLMLLMGYITIILVLLGAFAGGVLGAAFGAGAGAIPGALAGAAAGLEASAALGEALLVSYLLAEGVTVQKAILDLLTARQTQDEKNRDYTQTAASLIGMGMALILVAIMWLLSSLISAVVKSIKGGKAPAVETKPVTEKAPAAEGEPPTKPGKAEPKTEAPEIVDGERVVAKERTADGHEVKITEEGRCLVCTICEDIEVRYREEFKAKRPEVDSIKAELDNAKAMPNDAAKAEAVAKIEKNLEKVRSDIRTERLERLSNDPQTGKTNRKSIDEAEGILQAEKEGMVINPDRPNLAKGEPNLDFKVDGPPPFKWADVKTPVNRGDLKLQAEGIGRKTMLQKAGARDVVHIVDLKNIPSGNKAAFMQDVLTGAGAPDGIFFINK